MFVSHKAFPRSHQAQACWPKDSQVAGAGGVSAFALCWRGHLQRHRWACASSLLPLSLFSSSHPLPFELKQLDCMVKRNLGTESHIIWFWLTRLISHLQFLPCEVPVEQRWQPERFLFLPGFLDKNNDLLFRNLKEVSVDRECSPYSAEWGVRFKIGWHLREEILLDSTWRMHVHRAALWKDKWRCPKFTVLLKSKKNPKPKPNKLLWRILCTLSLKPSLSADHVQLWESYHKSVFWQDRADRQKATRNGKNAKAGWKWGCFLFFKTCPV